MEKLTGEIVRDVNKSNAYTKLNDGTVWPSYKQGYLEWHLRYGRKEYPIEKRMVLACIVNAYKALIDQPQKRRNEICKALKDARK